MSFQKIVDRLELFLGNVEVIKQVKTDGELFEILKVDAEAAHLTHVRQKSFCCQWLVPCYLRYGVLRTWH